MKCNTKLTITHVKSHSNNGLKFQPRAFCVFKSMRAAGKHFRAIQLIDNSSYGFAGTINLNFKVETAAWSYYHCAKIRGRQIHLRSAINYFGSKEPSVFSVLRSRLYFGSPRQQLYSQGI